MRISKNLEEILDKTPKILTYMLFFGLIYASWSLENTLDMAFSRYIEALMNVHEWNDFGPSGVFTSILMILMFSHLRMLRKTHKEISLYLIKRTI